MPYTPFAGSVAAAGIDDWGAKLVAIPVGYAIGAWIGTLIGLGIGFDRNERTDLRDLLGAIGGGMGLLVWLIISF